MKIEVNGIEYENFLSSSAELRLDALSNTFSFEAAGSGGAPLPFKGGEACKVTLEGETIITGFIEVVSGSYDAGSHNISIQGRDKTGDVLDSSVSEMSDLRGANTVKQVIERVLENIGSDVVVIDEANSEKFNSSEDIQAPDPGDNAFSFMESVARKRQVLLTSDGGGNIIISKSPGQDTQVLLQNVVGATGNNILSASWSYDTTGRYNIYRFKSGLNPVALNTAGAASISTIVNQSGLISDTQIRAGRQLVIVAELSSSDEQMESRATWEANIRKARGRVYSAVVEGFTHKNGVWKPNTLVNIVDDFAGVSAQMLINSVSFNLDLRNGSTTTLSFVERNAYTLTLDEPKTQELGF